MLQRFVGLHQHRLVTREMHQRLRRHRVETRRLIGNALLLGVRGPSSAHRVPGLDLLAHGGNLHGHLPFQEAAAVVGAQRDALAAGAGELERMLWAGDVLEPADSHRAFHDMIVGHHFQQRALHARPVLALRGQLVRQGHECAARRAVGIPYGRQHGGERAIARQDGDHPVAATAREPAAAEQVEAPGLALVLEGARQHEGAQLARQPDFDKRLPGQAGIERIGRMDPVVHLELAPLQVDRDMAGIAHACRDGPDPPRRSAHARVRAGQVEAGRRMALRDVLQVLADAQVQCIEHVVARLDLGDEVPALFLQIGFDHAPRARQRVVDPLLEGGLPFVDRLARILDIAPLPLAGDERVGLEDLIEGQGRAARAAGFLPIRHEQGGSGCRTLALPKIAVDLARHDGLQGIEGPQCRGAMPDELRAAGQRQQSEA